MNEKFSELMDSISFGISIAEIKTENRRDEDISHNTDLYRRIICREPGEHTISSIARLLNIKTTAVTQKVNELERKGYVIRKQCEKDKRVSYLYGVEEQCPCRNFVKVRDEYVISKLSESYKEEEILALLVMLEKMNDYYMEYDKKVE